jgi:ubiquinone/menaquinone biosynthesis C-methylase UbiE
MEQSKFSAIAHRDHTFFSPLNSAKVDQILALLELSPGDPVLDIGCGQAEILLRLMEGYKVRATGVDRNPEFLDKARANAVSRDIPTENLQLHNMDASSFAAEPASSAAAICCGSTHAYGGYRQTLAALSTLVKPGGQILVGEGYWKRQPDPAYLEALGAAPDDFTGHAGNVTAGVGAGLIPLYSSVSSEDDWDHYEGLYCRGIERYTFNHPEDPDCEAMQQRIRKWRDTYLRYGRDTLGFGLYLFMKPAA